MITLYADADAIRWMSDAACRHVIDPDIFFPAGHTGPATVEIRAAKAICADCPVLGECRDWALGSKQAAYGVWGGLTEIERATVRRSRKRRRRIR